MESNVRITWLCQSGFLFDSGGVRLLVDPFLSAGPRGKGFDRLQPPPLSVAELRPTAVFSSHDHLDHFDPNATVEIARAYPDCIFIGPRSVTDHLGRLDVDPGRAVTLCVDGACTVGPFLLTGVQAFHSDKHAIGLIIEVHGRRIYFSGDTEYDDSLADNVLKTAGGQVDLVLICINGKLGNMAWGQALCTVLGLRPKAAVPMHYGLFPANTEDPKPFVDGCLANGIASRTLSPGQAVTLDELLAPAPA